ncbi:GGDEF domain-containing protein [Clostridium sp. Marseille-P2415]|uniref:GGDEF domain-containing protein n=1 Tax=Clostridium sp. Marseille-P2415 TaxID=1805471 RepID=UPI0009886511|nr:GGDEF domain-containing protein [Clostridium sp. Marseille-P2415]
MNNISLDEIKDKLDFFNKMYDAVRLIDPLHKRVLEYRGSSLEGTKDVCYDYWGNSRICENCISIRSYQEDRSFVKMEKSEDTVLLVTAIPIGNSSRPAVLELLKNATDTMLIGSGDYNKGEMLSRFVQELNDIIVKDPLTSLYNRRFIAERLPADIIEATLMHMPLSVCFFDMDNFKSINDLYGHESGDLAIKAVGEAISRNIRFENAWAARYGGDEFLLYLKNTEEDQARVIAERIQRDVENISADQLMKASHLSISFGIETMKDIPMTAEELIRRADEKMYQAKNAKSSQYEPER